MNENLDVKRILFLDPNHENVNSFRNKASKLSFPVFIVAASKTISAIDLLEHNDFDLIVSQVFPANVINGIGIVERLRKGSFGEQNKDIPVVAYTLPGFTDLDTYFDAGFNNYVAAPDNGNKLVKVIEKLLVSELVEA